MSPRGPSRHEAGFWTERKVAWYRRALARSDYARRVLDAIAPALAECQSALDVGAGPGALALPLAARLRQVTALEPAPAMALALRDEARRRGVANLRVVEAAWGAVPLPAHDLVVCAHVADLLRSDAPFLDEGPGLARRWVVLVRDVATDADKLFFRELYPALLGRPYGSGASHEDTLAGLAARGTSPTVTLVDYRSDQPFDDLEEACAFYQDYLSVDGPRARDFLRTFLAARLLREGATWIAPCAKRAAVIWWSVAGRAPAGEAPGGGTAARGTNRPVVRQPRALDSGVSIS